MSAEFVVAWSGAIETAAARAVQRQPDVRPPRAHSNVDIVLACIEDNPGVTMRRISEITGLRIGEVNGTLYTLLRNARVARSHRQDEQLGVPVQWRIRS